MKYTNNLPLHPLLTENEDGTKKNAHYDKAEEPAILHFEKKYSLRELHSWSKITADKYLLRMEYKNQKLEDIKKRQKYLDYAKSLEYIMTLNMDNSDLITYDVYKKCNIRYRY